MESQETLQSNTDQIFQEERINYGLLEHCPSSDIMDLTQSCRQMPAENMKQTSHNVVSHMLPQKNTKKTASYYNQKVPENEAFPISPRASGDVQKQKIL